MRLSFIPVLAGAFALALPLSGCGDVGPSPASPTSGPIKPLYGGVKIVQLGTEQVTGPYHVTLTSDGTAAGGPIKFTVQITQNGKPFSQGFVTLALQSPGSKVDDDGKRMDKAGPGAFTSTLSANQAGDWLAKVTVVGVAGTNPAYFSFTAG